MLNQILTSSFFESFIYNKNRCFFPFLKVLILTVVFSMKAITENQLHDFLIYSRYSCKKYCLHNSTLLGITITVDPRIKFGIRKKYCLHNSTLLGITITVDPRIKFGLRKGEHLFR